ncbi:MAG: dehypoxanthine futalosine cyclase [Candidatus Thermoplasmatota archaeon]|nr:dehypoxanthine futalosine cyclase [Candidatus Thermoplasmatota archaeon]MCL5962774.1 dehypoxanthine futalosine cyclase [Candidatus Thermoplasmatota archaeon]
MLLENIVNKVKKGERISEEEAVYIYKKLSLLEIGKLADYVRWRALPYPLVTFVIDRNINYTNVCTVNCKFCAFYTSPNAKDGYVLTEDEILKKVDELVKKGGTQVLLQGGLNPSLDLNDVVNMIKSVKEHYPQVDIHSFTTTEINYYAKKENITVKETLQRLKDAGLRSLPGGGAEILVDRVRNNVSPLKNSVQSWLDVMDEAQKLGMPTTSTMVFGMGETVEERIEHLSKIRELQDRNHGFTAFIPWSFEPKNTVMDNIKRATAYEYLCMIAISRIFLDNIKNIQSGWVTEGAKIAQIALKFGANDFGGILMEEHVISAAGKSNYMDVDLIIHTIKDAGFIPAQRNTYYEILKTF